MDYKKLGFKCGIEIHQQLEGKKLFCNCPTVIRKDKPDFEFDRRLRASAGESGKVDVVASSEQKKGKLFTYWGYSDINCLVEMDEEPPGSINQDALKTAMQVSKMLNCETADKIQFMRKTVVDGSNTSGFQRTALIGRNGFITVNGKKIGIAGVFLEEEACQIMKRTKEHDIYNLSRLGIPLLEVSTDPDIRSPEECKEVAAKIGMILRSTGACKRGIGSIRQDVNISIKGGVRTEVKGFQDLKSIPKVIEAEVKRHQKLLTQKKKMINEVRKAEPDFSTSFLRLMPGASRMYPETDVPAIIPKVDGLEKVETIDDREKHYKKKFDLNLNVSKQVVKEEDRKHFNFEEIATVFPNIAPSFIASSLTQTSTEMRRHFNWDPEVEVFTEEIFPKLNAGYLTSSSVSSILEEKSKGKTIDYSKYEVISSGNLEKEIKVIVEKNKGAPIGALMGMIMAKFKGNVDGKQAMDILKKYIN
ncbi:MAG: Glu-tRNA(Gln) amidotransferase subunit GatE [archaeon]